MRRLVSAFFIIVLLAVLGACSQAELEPGAAVEPTITPEPAASPTRDPNSPVEATPGANVGVDADAAIEAARSQLGARLGVDPSEIVVVSSSEAEWPNGCLGLAEPDEMCTEALVSGWLVILQVPGDEVLYEARTDATGNAVRFQQTADPTTELPVGAVRAREQLADELGVGVEEVEVVSFTQEEWRDSCLGLGGPAESCLQAITPGWQVTLAAGGEEYEARTDRAGNSVRFANMGRAGTAGPPLAGDVVLVFEQSGGIAGETVTYRIYRDGTMERMSGTPGQDAVSEAVTVDPDSVTQLLTDLEDAGFFELEGDQMPDDACCDRFNYTLTVTSDAESNTVSTVEATEGLPDAVWESIDLVRRFVDTFGTAPTS